MLTKEMHRHQIFLVTIIVTIVPMVWVLTKEAQSECQLTVDISGNVRHNYSAHCAVINEVHYICKNLNYIKEVPIRNGTCVRLREDTRLINVLNFQNIIDIRFYSYPDDKKFRVICNDGPNTYSGFNFVNSSFISVTNIHFANCGHKRLSTVKLRKTEELVDIWSAFFFSDVSNIRFDDINLTVSHGYSVVLYNTIGEITFNRVEIADSKLVPFRSKIGKLCLGYSSGGAIYMEYNKHSRLKMLDVVTKVYVFNSLFSNNTADNVSATLVAEGMAEGHIGFGRGGAFGIFLLDNTRNVKIHMINSSFYHNRAAWGGAVYVRFRENSFNNTIEVETSSFYKNIGALSGGGLFVTDTQKSDFLNDVHVHGCIFDENEAEVGGGLNYKYISRKSIENNQFAEIYNTIFNNNTAKIGFAMNLELILMRLYNVTLTSNKGKHNTGQGSIYSFKSNLHFEGFADIRKNRQTSIVSDYSIIFLPGMVTFDENIGENGGAISMYGDSMLVLFNSTRLTFSRNTAWRRGGAIYYQQPGPSIEHSVLKSLQLVQCFIQFNGSDLETAANNTFKGKVYFRENNATINGDSIFTTSLIACNIKASNNDTFNKWRGFHFMPADRTHIITRAVRIKLFKDEWNQPPGLLFRPKIFLLDERGNHVSEQINVQIRKNADNPDCTVFIETNPRFVVTKNDNISLKLLGDNRPVKHCSFDVTVSLAWNTFTSHTILNRRLKPCNFGYTFNFENLQCRCMMRKNRAKGIAYCSNGKSFFFQNRWAYPKQKAFKTDGEITVVCPKGYCKKCKDGICMYNDSNPQQCRPNRDQNSKICGSCAPGYSVAFGSEDCVRCYDSSKYNLIWIIVVIVVLLTIIVVIIILLGIDIYSNYLNGLLYYCQVVVLLTPSAFQFWQPMKFIIGMLTLESTGGVFSYCLIPGFNNLHKQVFNYLLPTTVLFILYVVGRLAKRPNSYFARRNCLGAFTIISVLAYTDITRITFNLLTFSCIDPASSTRWLWIHGETLFLGKDHLPYFVAAVFIIIVIVLGFPLVLVYSSRLTSLRLSGNPFTKLTPIFEQFTYCYRRGYLYFASFYFFARLVLVGIDAFSVIGPYTSTLKCLACCLICIFFAFNKPYKEMMMNYFDLFVLINLTLVSMLRVMVLGFASPKKVKTVETIVNCLVVLPFIPVIVRMVWVYGKKLYEWKQKWQAKKQTKPPKTPEFHYPYRTLVSTDEEDNANDDEDNEDSSRNDDFPYLNIDEE